MFNIFSSNPTPAQAPAQPAPAAQQPAPGNIPEPQIATAQGEGTAPNGVVPQETPVTQEAQSPLDSFKDLWQTAPNEGTSEAAPATELTQEAVQNAVAKIDFSSVVPADTLQAIAGGGETAAAAFTQAMQAVAQNVMVQSTLVNNKLTQQAVDNAVKQTSATLPELLRKQAATNHLRETNPLFSNPAVKPVVEATQAQLLQKFPNATHAEITQMTQDYILAMGKEFAPATPASSTAEGENWEAFLS